MAHSFGTLLPLAILASLSTVARAQADAPPANDPRAEADVEFNQGKVLMDAGQTAAACARFARSQELDPKLGRLLNLAFCHEQEGKTASAWNEYNGAAALAEQKGQGERAQFAREHAAEVAKRLAFVHFDVPPNAAALEVDGAGLSRDKWATPLPFDPGEHKVVATAPGKKPRTMIVSVGAIPGLEDFPIEPLEDDSGGRAPVGQPPPAPRESRRSPPIFGNVPAMIATGVGAGGIAVGAVFGLHAMSKKNAAASDCPDKLCDPDGRLLISAAQSAATVSTVGFGVGLVGAAAATWLFVRPLGSEAPSARMTAMVGPRLSGLAVEGFF